MQEYDSRKDLETMVIEIKLGTERLIAKLDQLNSGVSRLESSLCKVDKTVEELEKKVIIIEQELPDDLRRDLALLKNAQDTQTKFMWLLGGSVLSVIVKLIADLIMR